MSYPSTAPSLQGWQNTAQMLAAIAVLEANQVTNTANIAANTTTANNAQPIAGQNTPGATGYSQLVAAPSTASSTGVAGQIAYDATHIYVCVATNTWVRATLATF